jgi:hypothetical protein
MVAGVATVLLSAVLATIPVNANDAAGKVIRFIIRK